jgi:hypothetical protein
LGRRWPRPRASLPTCNAVSPASPVCRTRGDRSWLTSIWSSKTPGSCRRGLRLARSLPTAQYSLSLWTAPCSLSLPTAPCSWSLPLRRHGNAFQPVPSASNGDPPVTLPRAEGKAPTSPRASPRVRCVRIAAQTRAEVARSSRPKRVSIAVGCAAPRQVQHRLKSVPGRASATARDRKGKVAVEQPTSEAQACREDGSSSSQTHIYAPSAFGSSELPQTQRAESPR